LILKINLEIGPENEVKMI